MADTKITALTALTAADPANDVIPIVDVSDTTMAASGTTKKISVNNILGASGTATLASATITGDLTVRTNKLKVDATGVGIGTASPSSGTLNINSHFILLGDSQTKMGDNGLVNGVSSDGNSQIQFFGGKSLFFNEGASNTKMTLNSTGLGVGVTPTGTGGCLQLKSGITFPATQVASSDANTLDDYEEGTFTPTVSSVGGTGIVYVAGGSDAGKYTKIGNLVRFTVNLSGTYTGTFSYIRIALPFTVGTTTDAVSGYDNGTGLGLAGRTDVASARFIVIYPQPSGSLGIYSGSFNA